MQVRQLTKAEMDEVRAIAKGFGVKGCCFGTFFSHVGKQCVRINEPKAFIGAIKAAGFFIDEEETCLELADNGLLDSVMLAKAA